MNKKIVLVLLLGTVLLAACEKPREMAPDDTQYEEKYAQLNNGKTGN